MLSACGNKITDGIVYKKEFVPEHLETVLMPIISSDGETVITTYFPHDEHYPDKFYVYIQSKDSDENGQYEIAKYSVSEEIYNSLEIGDFYSYEN